MYAFFVWVSYGVTMFTVFVLRRQLPEANRPFKVSFVVLKNHTNCQYKNNQSISRTSPSGISTDNILSRGLRFLT